jgi:hypothetical protein
LYGRVSAEDRDGDTVVIDDPTTRDGRAALEASVLLDETTGLRARALAEIKPGWFPPFVFGILTLASLVVESASTTRRLWYWGIGGLLALVAIYERGRYRRSHSGVVGRILPEALGVAVTAVIVTMSQLSLSGGRGIRFLASAVGWSVPHVGIIWVSPIAIPLAFVVG